MKKNDIFIRQKTYTFILSILDSVITGKKYPGKLINELFKDEYLTSDEKAVIVELVYRILRHLGRLDYIIEHSSRARLADIDPGSLNILRICAHQAIFSASSAAGIINNAVALSSQNTRQRGFIKRVVEAVVKNKDAVIFPDSRKDQIDFIAAYHSHPRWIVEKWVEELGSVKEVEALCSANNKEPPLTIRVNPLKADIVSLQELLEKEDYSSSRTGLSPFGLHIDRKVDIFKTRAFREGFFEVQDEGSQLVTLIAGAKPGELIIDACAGNGGKSLFLSGLMKNRGTLIASDLSPSKLMVLRKRAKKAGAFNIMTAGQDGLNAFYNRADCVFIDVPCSGMGVFRRKPESKWNITGRDIEELVSRQKEILRNCSRFVRPGGRLVYATCTISREENEENVRAFLEENRDFLPAPISGRHDFGQGTEILEAGSFRSMPHRSGTDGFFCAVMMKKE